MHPPFARLVFSALIVLLAHPAQAQDAGKLPSVDESKIPDWVKRQAASPQKFIINSAVVKAKAEPPKPEPVVVRAARQAPRKLSPLAAETTAAGPALQAAPAAEAASAPADAPANMLGGEATELPPTETPAPATTPAAAAAAVSTAPPTLTQPLPTEPEVPAPALPDAATAPAAAAAPALVLLDKVDPALTPDLIDNRLAEASVTVAFTVGTKGEVLDPQVTASTDRRLNRAVLRAVAEWHYAPVNEPRPHSVKFTFAVTP